MSITKVCGLEYHIRVFLSGTSYDPPWICFVCERDIEFRGGKSSMALVVHHQNEDREDNRIENLLGCHAGCHVRWHMRIRGLLREAVSRAGSSELSKPPYNATRGKSGARVPLGVKEA